MQPRAAGEIALQRYLLHGVRCCITLELELVATSRFPEIEKVLRRTFTCGRCVSLVCAEMKRMVLKKDRLSKISLNCLRFQGCMVLCVSVCVVLTHKCSTAF